MTPYEQLVEDACRLIDKSLGGFLDEGDEGRNQAEAQARVRDAAEAVIALLARRVREILRN